MEFSLTNHLWVVELFNTFKRHLVQVVVVLTKVKVWICEENGNANNVLCKAKSGKESGQEGTVVMSCELMSDSFAKIDRAGSM